MPAPIVPEISDIIASINAYATDKTRAKELAAAMRTDAKDVALSLINVGKSQKQTEIGGDLHTLTTKLEEVQKELEQRDAELADLRSKAPDATAIEASAQKKWEPKVRTATERAEKAEAAARTRVKDVGKQKFVEYLMTPDDQGLRVDPLWAKKVVAAEFDDRFVPKDDYSLSVLQPGETIEYDGDTEDERIKALARDARRTVPSAYMLTNADSGAGIRNGGGGSVGTNTLQQIIEQKKQNPAFAGL